MGEFLDHLVGLFPGFGLALLDQVVPGGAGFADAAVAFFTDGPRALGLFFGPAQAASRSFMARLAPEEELAAHFGLFALSGRITGFLGPAVLAAVTTATASQRLGMATVLGFLVVGAAILVFSIGYMREHEHHKPEGAGSLGRFYFFFLSFLGFMVGLVVSNQLAYFSFYFQVIKVYNEQMEAHA